MNSALKIAAFLLSLAVIAVSGTGLTNAWLISRTEPADNSFISGIEPYGSLTVSKTVEHPLGSDYIIPESMRFSFEVDLGTGCAGRRFGSYSCDERGIIDIEVPADGSAVIDGIPVSAGTVTVSEKDIPAGFTPEGGASKEIRISQAEDVRADFVNVYSPEPADNSLSVMVTKTLEGRAWKDSDEFIFILEELKDGEWRRISEGSASRNRRTVDFGAAMRGLVFSEAGTYKFRVKEDEGSAGGVTYDRAVRYFDVIVADDDMDGSLEIKSPEMIEMGFTNSYAPHGSAAVDIDIVKEMSDTSGQDRGPEGFRFGLYEGDRLIAASDETSAAGMAVIRQVFTPEDIGTYHRTLREIDAGDPGVAYDTREYELGITVADNGDGSVSAFIYDLDNDRSESSGIPPGVTGSYEAEFANTYDLVDASLTIRGVKRLEGRKLRAGEFRFELYETGPGYDSAEGAAAATAVNADDGSFGFDLTYGRAGTYHYVIKEDASALPGGVICDSSEYHVRVDVTDAGGTLKAEPAVTDAEGHERDIVFTNRYSPKPSVLILQGLKVLKGRALREGEFSFALYRTDRLFRREELVCETSNNSDGSFSFGELCLDEEGRYYFIVRELAGSPDGDISYDSSVYHITAEVSDDGEGSLVTEYEISELCGGTERSAEEIRFTNTYLGPDQGGNGRGRDAGKNDVSGSGDANAARTGDQAVLIVWMIIMVVSAVCLAAALRRAVRRRNDRTTDDGKDD